MELKPRARLWYQNTTGLEILFYRPEDNYFDTLGIDLEQFHQIEQEFSNP